MLLFLTRQDGFENIGLEKREKEILYYVHSIIQFTACRGETYFLTRYLLLLYIYLQAIKHCNATTSYFCTIVVVVPYTYCMPTMLPAAAAMSE